LASRLHLTSGEESSIVLQSRRSLSRFQNDLPCRNHGDTRLDRVHVHHQLTITVIEAVARGERSWLRIQFQNAGNRPVKVTSSAAFVAISPGATSPGRPQTGGAHIWPPSTAMDGKGELPIVLQPGELQTISVNVHYEIEDSRDTRHAFDTAEVTKRIDYFLRIQTEELCGEPRISSFRYMTREVAPRQTAVVRPFPAREDYPTSAPRGA
jgi:hypothetical protein